MKGKIGNVKSSTLKTERFIRPLFCAKIDLAENSRSHPDQRAQPNKSET